MEGLEGKVEFGEVRRAAWERRREWVSAEERYGGEEEWPAGEDSGRGQSERFCRKEARVGRLRKNESRSWISGVLCWRQHAGGREIYSWL